MLIDTTGMSSVKSYETNNRVLQQITCKGEWVVEEEAKGEKRLKRTILTNHYM